jgi:hypothetical protein
LNSSEYSFPRYLAAKKSVDDRALNFHVRQALKASIPRTFGEKPLKVLEIGAGIGTMIERMLEWDLLEYADYTAIDAQIENITFAKRRLLEWGDQNDYQAVEKNGEMFLGRDTTQVKVSLFATDLFDFIASECGKRTWDLLVAHAFLDLVDVPSALPQIFSLAREASWFYFSINYDGLMVLEPEIDFDFDRWVLELYHRTMEHRSRDGQLFGDRYTGRHLFQQIQENGGRILASGSSDWVVYAEPGGYPNDEAYFLHFIIDTIYQALINHPELDNQQFEEWIHQRHAQVERWELIYIAHQIDYFGIFSAN